MTFRSSHPAYELSKRLNEGLVGMRSHEHGMQLWTRGKARKVATCRCCESTIERSEVSWRPLTNGYNRMHRICDTCIANLTPTEAAP